MRVCQSISEFQDDFEMGKTLGMGGFAVVKMCKKKATGVMHAVKVVDKTRYQPGDQSLAREVAVLQTVMHSNCMRLDEVYVTPRHVLVVSELAEGGELHTELVRRGRFPEAEAASITKQILKGVQYLHSCGIVHRVSPLSAGAARADALACARWRTRRRRPRGRDAACDEHPVLTLTPFASPCAHPPLRAPRTH